MLFLTSLPCLVFLQGNFFYFVQFQAFLSFPFNKRRSKKQGAFSLPEASGSVNHKIRHVQRGLIFCYNIKGFVREKPYQLRYKRGEEDQNYRFFRYVFYG